MPSAYLKNGTRGPLGLSSGRVLDVGEIIASGDVDPKDPHDQALLEDGSLVESVAPGEVPTGDEFDALKGEELDKAAADADIDGRSQMTAEQKRDALRAYAAEQAQNADEEGTT